MNRMGCLAAGIVLLAQTSLCGAADKTWSRPSSGDWAEPSNWTPPGVPEATNSVSIASGSVAIRSNVTVSALHLAGGLLQSVQRTNTITCTNLVWSGGTIKGAGVTFIPRGGSLVLTGANEVTLTSHTLRNAGSALWASRGSVALSSGAVVLNDGTFDAQAVGYMFGSPGAFINAGTLVVTNPFVFTTFYTPVTNRGTMLITGASLRGLFGFTQTAGRMVLENARLDADGGVRVLGGSLSGDGTINGAYFLNRGDLLPGLPLGTLRIIGNFTNTGHVYVDLQSAPGPPMSDLIQVPYGHARLGGTLHVCYNGFVGPVPVFAFTIVSAASMSGSFAHMDGLDLGGGSVLVPAQGPGPFTLFTSTGVRRDGVIALVGCGEGVYQVRFTGIPATPYQIDAATDLGEWTTLLRSNSTSGVIYHLDTDAPALPRRFYRAKQTR